MKALVELFKKRGLLFKELAPIDPKSLGLRKKIALYEGVDLKNRYVLIAKIERKSRFLQKDALSLLEISQLLQQKRGHGYALRYLLLQAPLCSKAKSLLEEKGFRVVTL